MAQCTGVTCKIVEHFKFKTTTKNHYQHFSLKFSMAPSQSPPNSPEVLDLCLICPIALLRIYCFLCPVFELYINKLYCAPTPATRCISVDIFWSVIHVDAWSCILFHCSIVFHLAIYMSQTSSGPLSLPFFGHLPWPLVPS